MGIRISDGDELSHRNTDWSIFKIQHFRLYLNKLRLLVLNKIIEKHALETLFLRVGDEVSISDLEHVDVYP